MDDVFEKTYYSHKLKMRKPAPEIYEYVIDDNRLIPNETLFLDDTYDNILAAEELRINTFHVSYPDRWIDELFNE